VSVRAAAAAEAAHDVDVVLVTHQSAAALPSCLTALGPLAARVVAVDNASSDGTRAVLRAHGVRTLPLVRNLGFAAAANLGAQATEARILCFLNPDCVAPCAVFAAAHATLAGRDDACAVPRIVERGLALDGRQPGYGRVKLVHDMLRTNYGDGPLCRWLARHTRFHDASWSWPHGACLFIPRTLFRRLGGFDERFFLYMEDVDLGRRLAARGGQVLRLDAEVEHGGAAGSAIPHRRQLMLLNRGRVRYAALHHGRWLAGLLAAVALPSMAARAALGPRP
jgi:GT2 family glycosyltransferase